MDVLYNCNKLFITYPKWANNALPAQVALMLAL